jgi:hypothetical protein
MVSNGCRKGKKCCFSAQSSTGNCLLGEGERMILLFELHLVELVVNIYVTLCTTLPYVGFWVSNHQHPFLSE